MYWDQSCDDSMSCNPSNNLQWRFPGLAIGGTVPADQKFVHAHDAYGAISCHAWKVCIHYICHVSCTCDGRISASDNGFWEISMLKQLTATQGLWSDAVCLYVYSVVSKWLVWRRVWHSSKISSWSHGVIITITTLLPPWFESTSLPK